MSFQQFKYYFLEEDGRSIYRNGNVVTSTGVHRPQGLSPDGWQEIQLAWERNMQKYFGLTRNFSLPLTFLGESAFILKHEFAKINVERKIYLMIQELFLEMDPAYYKYIYKYLYKGLIDLSTFKASEDKVNCNIMEGGLIKLFKNGENTTQTIPFDEDAIDIFLDGVFIQAAHTFQVPEGGSIASTFNPSVFSIINEGTAAGLAVFNAQQNNDAIDGNNQNYFAISTQDITGLKLTGKFILTNAVGNTNQRLDLVRYNIKSNITTVENLFTGIVNSGTDVTVDKDASPYSFDVTDGDRLFLRSSATTSGLKESNFKIEYRSKYQATTILAYKPIDAWRRLVEGMTGSKDNAQSNLLIANKNLALTCGDAIRGIKTATLKTSPSDFIEDYSLTTFAGFSIDNGKMKLEDRATFFDISDPIALGIVKNHEWSEATDLLGNLYKIGSLKPEIDDVNGKFDPNGSSHYSNPLQSIPKDIDMVGPYKKGPYEIEMLRINLEGKTTTDDSSDNQCFVIDVKEIPPVSHSVNFDAESKAFASGDDLGLVQGMRVAISGTTSNNQKLTILSVTTVFSTWVYVTDGIIVDESGVIATFILPHILDRDPVVTAPVDICPSPETIFNVRLTPKNILFKNERWIHSQMHGFESEKLKWKYSDKLSGFSAIVDGRVVDEDRDEDISSLAPKLFLPVYHDFEAIVPFSYQGKTLVELLEDNPNRCFEFQTEEGTFLGFNVKAGYAPNSLAAQQFKLLSAPTNDLTLLIN